jgi:DNA-binding beta-propeller fold protein YncE
MNAMLVTLIWLAALWLESVGFGAQIILVAGVEQGQSKSAPQSAPLREPFATGFDHAGNIFILEMASGNRLLKLDRRGTLTTIAGRSPTSTGATDESAALDARLNGAHSLAVLPDGNVLVADTWNGRIRKVDLLAKTITDVPGFSVPSDKGRSSGPYCIALDVSGTKLYVADLNRIQVIDLRRGTATLVAGNGQKGVPTDGALALEAPLVDPRAVAPDRKGNVYVLERSGHALRVVDSTGRIRTVINSSGRQGVSGDGGPGREALMNGPKHLCVDLHDDVIIADAENHLVRKYLSREERMVRLAGTGKQGSQGLGGDPLNCELNRPHGVAVHPESGELFITDSYNHRVLKIVE